MPWCGKGPSTPEDPDDVVFDDGGSGLFDACLARFTGYGCTVECDSRHAVWVKNADESYTVGLAPWLVELRSVEEILSDVEAKMKNAALQDGE
jgi:hypothetical protein